MGCLMPPYPLTNFEIQKYYKNEPKFNGVFSGNNLPKKIKDGAYVINLDEYADIGTHWVALFCNRNEIVYFNSFQIVSIEISKIENYFHEEVNQRKSCSKKLGIHVAPFDYIDMILIVLSATTGGVAICPFTSIAGAPAGIASASFTLIFSLTTGIIKNY